MKATRMVILIETLLIILAAAVAPRVYMRTRDEIDRQSETIETMRKQNDDMIAQYEDVNAMYEELRRRDVAESIEQHAEDVDPELPNDVAELKRMISTERKQHAEVEDAFDRLAARLDEQVSLAAAAGTPAPGRRSPDAPAFDGRLYEEHINRWVGNLQRRIEQTDDPRLQQNLALVGNTVQNMRELSQKAAHARSDAERREVYEQLTAEQRRLSRITQETRRLEFNALADTFGIPEDRKIEFSRRVNHINSSAIQPFAELMRAAAGPVARDTARRRTSTAR